MGKTNDEVSKMRYDLFDKDGKFFDLIDSTNNPRIREVKVVVVATPKGNRYFQYVGMINHHEKCQDCVPAFVECEVVCFNRD